MLLASKRLLRRSCISSNDGALYVSASSARHLYRLKILGDGSQRKSYLYVQDCLDAMLTVIAKSADPVNVYNLGADEYCNVDQSLGWITAHLGLNPTRNYTGGDRGWIGDSPFIFLDTKKVRALGWKPTLTIREAVIRTLEYLQQETWVLQQR